MVRGGTGRTDRNPSISFFTPITQNPSRIKVISLIRSSVIDILSAAFAGRLFGFRNNQVRYSHAMALASKVLGKDVSHQPPVTFLRPRLRTK